MRKFKGIAGVGVAGLITAGLVVGGAIPAFAGEWAWGAKNCGGNFPTTNSSGTGSITHAISLNGAILSRTFNDGTVTTRKMVGTEHWASGASVAGGNAIWGSFTC